MEPQRLIRSQRGDRSIDLTFFNATNRHLDVFWANYEGKLVRYFYRVPPQARKEITTYETHPWVARDSDTGSRVCFSGQHVYIAKVPKRRNAQGEEEELDFDETPKVDLSLHIPVYRLEEICVDFFRRILSKNEMPQLEVCRSVMDKLCFDPQPPISIYQHPNQRRQN